MTFSQFISVLSARWRDVLGAWLVVVVAALVLSLVLPKQYTASAMVMVDVKSPDPVANETGATTTLTSTSYMATQMDVLQSERVILRALRTLKLTDNAALREKWMSVTEGQGSFESWLVETFQRKLEVRPSRESSVIALSYTSTEPVFSANVLNAVVQAFIDTTLDLKVNPARQYSAFFDARAKELRGELENAQTKLSAYQQAKGLIATDEKLDVENTRLTELSTQLIALQAVASESSGRSRQAGKNGEGLSEVLTNPVVSSLSIDLSRQEARLKEISERLGPNHPQVLEQVATVGKMRDQLASEKRRASTSVTVDNSVNQQRLRMLMADVDAQRARVLTLKGQRDEASVLRRDVESAQRAYDAVLNHATQAELQSRNTETNVSILKTATPPALPSAPKTMLNVVVAVLLGALLGMVLAVAREMLDPRLRSEQDILNGLKQNLLVVLPLSTKRTAGGRSRLLSAKTRVIGLSRPAVS